jgi:cation diffusion facilitator family transporter
VHQHDLSPWRHDHTFGQDRVRPGERRTLVVIALTATTMVAEISAGLAFGSMALLADGMHMASHAAALAISAAAYVYARRHAADERYSFGTGKVNALGGYTGAVLLALFALAMAWESVDRLRHPVEIAFDQAILVAVIGLLVNAASVVILGGHGHGDEEHHHHGHSHAHSQAHDHHADDGADHNLRSAYLHVAADALTSLLAIGALLSGKYLGWSWLDPAMGIVGALLVARWSRGLLRDTSRVLLDEQAPEPLREAVRAAVESEAQGDRVADLHVWSIGPEVYAGAVSVVSDEPREPDDYKRRLPPQLAHATIEVHRCRDHERGAAS